MHAHHIGNTSPDTALPPHLPEPVRNYLDQHTDAVSILTHYLIREQIPLSILAEIDFPHLQNVIKNITKFDEILKVLTLEQALKLAHTPRTISDYKMQFYSPGLPNGISCSNNKDFYHEDYGNEIHIKRAAHQNGTQLPYYYKTRYQIITRPLSYEALASIQSKIDGLEVTHLLHDWVKIEHPDASPLAHNTYISINGAYLIEETYPLTFPIDSLIKDHLSFLFSNPYYHEKYKENVLESLGYSYQKLRALNGMTESKLRIFTESLGYTAILSQAGITIESLGYTATLLQAGMTIEELTAIDNSYLAFLIDNCYAVKAALQLGMCQGF